MHELAVTEHILKIALDAAETEGASRVTDIYLTIGRLSSVVDDSVQFYWDHISEGTLAEAAKLHFTRPPAVLRCRACQTEYELADELMPCPTCKGIDLEVISGEELQVDQIEIVKKEETNDPTR